MSQGNQNDQQERPGLNGKQPHVTGEPGESTDDHNQTVEQCGSGLLQGDVVVAPGPPQQGTLSL